MFFPADGRAGPSPAPGGTVDPPLSGTVWTRWREERGWFVETEHTVPMDGLHEPLEVLHLSDVHLRNDDAWLARLTGRVARLSPDLVVLTGDIVTRGWRRAAVDRFLAALPRAPLGRWAIMGNWEYWSGAPPDVWAPILAAHDIRLLIDQAVATGPLALVGTDDQLAGTPDLDRSFALLPSDRPTVVLTHSPSLFPALVRPEVNLVLAGHSHGGQVRLPALGALWVPMGTGGYVAGWYRQDDTWLFVHRGVGWSIAPVRLWCPPELARLRLVPA